VFTSFSSFFFYSTSSLHPFKLRVRLAQAPDPAAAQCSRHLGAVSARLRQAGSWCSSPKRAPRARRAARPSKPAALGVNFVSPLQSAWHVLSTAARFFEILGKALSFQFLFYFAETKAGCENS